MREQLRESVAAVWGLLWNAKTEEDRELAINTMRSVMESGGITHKDVEDWIRKDRLEIGGLEDVSVGPEQKQISVEDAAIVDLIKRIQDVHKNKLIDKEKEFLSDIANRLNSKYRRPLSYKQKKWVGSIARRCGEL